MPNSAGVNLQRPEPLGEPLEKVEKALEEGREQIEEREQHSEESKSEDGQSSRSEHEQDGCLQHIFTSI